MLLDELFAVGVPTTTGVPAGGNLFQDGSVLREQLDMNIGVPQADPLRDDLVPAVDVVRRPSQRPNEVLPA